MRESGPPKERSVIPPSLLDRMRIWLGYRLLRREYDAQAVQLAFHFEAQATSNRSELVQLFFTTLQRILGASYSAFYRKAEGEWFLDSALGQPPELDPVWIGQTCELPGGLVGPYRLRGELIGLVIVGPRQNRRGYTELDRNLFLNLLVLTALRLALYDHRVSEQTLSTKLAIAQEASALQEQFLNLVSHELRTPISIILAAISFLKDEGYGSGDPLLERYFGRIYRNSELLTIYLDDLLNAGQLNSGHFTLHPQAFPLVRLVQDALLELAPLAEEKRQRIDFGPSPDPVEVVADRQRLDQVFRNLVINAIKHNPAGSMIQVRLHPSAESLRLEVKDDGVGIAPEALPHLFERFSRVRQEGQAKERGVGLGLFIAKEIVEAHGGTLGVESLPGQGSTFWFELPRHPIPPPREPLRERQDGASPADFPGADAAHRDAQ